ncbi:hypothetical protein [Mesorhizobium sp. ISC15]|uniref:hypothetical protein n=1 Tax=Mesorhizobium sp. ISC15 TaxID=3076429 RepID=UPI00301CC54B
MQTQATEFTHPYAIRKCASRMVVRAQFTARRFTMHDVSSSHLSGSISRDMFVSFVRDLLGSYPNPDEPQPRGPWDPIIFAALQRMAWFGPHPEPWHSLFHVIAQRHPELWDILGGPLVRAALNPQPLPPRIAFAAALADGLIERAASAQEIADWLPQQGEQRGIIIVSGRLLQYVDDLCGNGLRLKFPKPVPPPPWWQEQLSGADLAVMGARFESAAAQVVNEALGGAFRQAGVKLIQTGLSKFQ